MPFLFLMGVSTGMRTLSATAVLCWFAYLQLLPQHAYLAWAGMLVSVIVFTVLALGEYVGDTLPTTPNRTAPGPLAARIVFGALAGALAARGVLEPLAGGIVFGVMGALTGAYGGIRVRLYLAKLVGHDRPVALAESALALAIPFYIAYKLHTYAVVAGFAPYKWMWS